jgi:hypothetical protein
MPKNPFTTGSPVNAIIRVRRGSEIDRQDVTFQDGEISWTTDKKRLYIGDDKTQGGVLVGNKIWYTNNFQKLSEIERYDLVYRTDTQAFYIFIGTNYFLESEYVLVGGLKFLRDNINTTSTYNLPNATKSDKGGVIVGNGLDVTNGIVSISYDPASFSIVGNKLTFIGSGGGGVIPFAKYDTYGKIRAIENTGLTLSNGDLSVQIDNDTLILSANSTGKSYIVVNKSVVGGGGVFYMLNDNSTSSTDYLNTNVLAVSTNIGLNLADNGELTLKKGTASEIGGVRSGTTTLIDADGKMNVKYDDVTIGIDQLGQLKLKQSKTSVGATNITTATTTYTLALSNTNTIIPLINTNPITITIPLNSVVPFNIGTEIVLIQKGGVATVTKTTGVTLSSNGHKYKTNGLYSGVTLIKIDTDEWFMGGDTAL